MTVLRKLQVHACLASGADIEQHCFIALVYALRFGSCILSVDGIVFRFGHGENKGQR